MKDPVQAQLSHADAACLPEGCVLHQDGYAAEGGKAYRQQFFVGERAAGQRLETAGDFDGQVQKREGIGGQKRQRASQHR